jgi:hypothetical protein
VQRVVKVVTPLRVHAVAVGIAGADDPRVVQVAFGDQEEAPTELSLECIDPFAQFLQEVDGRLVVDRMHCIEAKPVAVVIA